MEIPPGSSGVLEINNVISVYWVGESATDIITGWIELY
jgi:hypothetical protein